MMRLTAFTIDEQNFFFELGANPGLYISDEIDGLDSPEFFEDTEPLTGQYGDAIYNNLYRGRNIVIRGHVYNTTDSQYESMRKQLISMARIVKDVNGQVVYKTITFTTTGGSTYTTQGTMRIDMPWGIHTHARWTIFIHCPDPILYGDAGTSGLINRPSSSGVLIPALVPFTLGGSSGGNAIITNTGNGPTWPIWTLTGPLTNPRIYSQTLDRAFKLNYTLDANDTVVINTSPFYETVIRNGTDNFITYVDDIERDFFQLEPGENVILFSTSDTADTGTLEITYNSGNIGI